MTDLDQLSFTRRQAAQTTGFSEYTIGAAIRSGDLRETYPEINGKRLKNGVILRDDLLAWLKAGVTS